MRLVYFVHDLNDPAVAKRVAMLRAAGIDVLVTGFWRGSAPPPQVAGAPTSPLARSFDARLFHRAATTLRYTAKPSPLPPAFATADVFLARNLEMLAIASATRGRSTHGSTIVYEVLDVHRLLLGHGPAGASLRWIERRLLRNAALLITSSPAFLREYFLPRQFANRRVAACVIENKPLLSDDPQINQDAADLACGPPWRIGWFGMIRCLKSLEILGNLAQRRPDLVRVIIRGRPTVAVGRQLEHRLHTAPALSFGGPYAPADLESLYGSVHFNWTIDYFEEGGNSEWLLPNRLYEGGAVNAVPIALERTETGSWLRKLSLGVGLDDPTRELEPFLETLRPKGYELLKRAARNAPRSAFLADQKDCDRLAAILARAAQDQAKPFEARVCQAV